MDVYVDDHASYAAMRRRAETHSPDAADALDVHVHLLIFADTPAQLQGAPGRWRWNGDGLIESTLAGTVTASWLALNEQGDETSIPDDVTAVLLQDIQAKASPMSTSDE